MAITFDGIAEAVENFVRIECQVPSKDPLFTRAVHLYDMGYVDSMALVRLIAYLESAFNIDLPEEVLFSEAFTTINGISTLVQSLVDGRVSQEDLTTLGIE